jgi:hypothetical protein
VDRHLAQRFQSSDHIRLVGSLPDASCAAGSSDHHERDRDTFEDMVKGRDKPATMTELAKAGTKRRERSVNPADGAKNLISEPIAKLGWRGELLGSEG